MRHGIAIVVAAAVFGVSPARAQVGNGDFQSGVVAPWAVVPTAAGRTISSAVTAFDMDGGGPLGSSLAARVIVGQVAADTGFQGVSIEQSVPLSGGQTYLIRARWAVHAWVNVYNKSSGRFELVLGGEVVDSVDAPTAAPNLKASGTLRGVFTPGADGTYALAVRVVRDAPSGEEVFQYVDDVSVSVLCSGDFDASGSSDVADIFSFLAAWFAQAPGSDFNASGATDVADIFAFLSAWFAGC